MTKNHSTSGFIRLSKLEELRTCLANLQKEGELNDDGQEFWPDVQDTQETLEAIINEARRIGKA